jgi:hypothetical protein
MGINPGFFHSLTRFCCLQASIRFRIHTYILQVVNIHMGFFETSCRLLIFIFFKFLLESSTPNDIDIASAIQLAQLADG